jgi:hypothetical protein
MNARHCILILAVSLLACAAFADTTWVNMPEVSGTWTSNHSPYMIQNDVHIPSGSALAIGSGVTVFFTGQFFMTVDSNAAFSALGTITDSVRFTCDTTVVTNRWKGLWANFAADTIRFEYCILENAHSYTSGLSTCCGEALNTHYSDLQMRHSVIRFCVGVSEGGGFQMLHGSLDARNCTFTANHGSNGGAGQTIEALLHFDNCLFENNTASGGGGALDLMNAFADTVIFEDCIIRNNTCASNSGLGGGGVCCELSCARFSRCSITGNSGSYGGGVNAFGAQTLIMTDCLIADNVAASDGGGVGNLGATSHLERCVFDHNSASNGGALATYFNAGSTPQILNCTLVRNSASQLGSAVANGITGMYGTPQLVNTIIAFNTGSEAYSFAPNGSINLHHNAFFGNAAGNFYQNLQGGRCQNSQVNANGDSCDIDFNLILNPLFADTATGNFHLTTASPCIDAGWPNSPPDPDGTVADIGAFVYIHPEAAGEISQPVPSALRLSSYPNPFNAVSTLRYVVPASGNVSLKVFDLTGREVGTLLDKPLTAGSYSVQWNAENLPSGMYFAVLTTEREHLIQKLLLLK